MPLSCTEVQELLRSGDSVPLRLPGHTSLPPPQTDQEVVPQTRGVSWSQVKSVNGTQFEAIALLPTCLHHEFVDRHSLSSAPRAHTSLGLRLLSKLCKSSHTCASPLECCMNSVRSSLLLQPSGSQVHRHHQILQQRG